MIINYSLLPYILTGISLIALLASAGAVLSRKLKFNYGFLSPVAFVIYTLIGYLIAKHNTVDIVLSCNILISMFDAIIGWNFSMKLKANTGAAEGQLIEITDSQRILVMAIISSFFGVVGYMLAHNITI